MFDVFIQSIKDYSQKIKLRITINDANNIVLVFFKYFLTIRNAEKCITETAKISDISQFAICKNHQPYFVKRELIASESINKMSRTCFQL